MKFTIYTIEDIFNEFAERSGLQFRATVVRGHLSYNLGEVSFTEVVNLKICAYGATLYCRVLSKEKSPVTLDFQILENTEASRISLIQSCERVFAWQMTHAQNLTFIRAEKNNYRDAVREKPINLALQRVPRPPKRKNVSVI